jgi:hypothetical protein
METPSRCIWKWVALTADPETLILFADQIIRRFKWENLEEMIRIHPSSMLDIGPGTLDDSHIVFTALQSDVSGMFVVAEFTKKFRNRGTERLVVWRGDAIEAQIDTEPILLLSSKGIKHFLGIFEHSVVFLDHHL